MNGIDKTLVWLAGVPLVARTVEAFERSSRVGAIVLVVSREDLNAVADLSRQRAWKKVTAVRLGGARRQDSVRLGLQSLSADCEWVLVHDGARPLVTESIIEAGIAAAQHSGAAIAAVPAKDTIKVAANDVVQQTLDRATLVQVQTPQVFRRGLLERGHREVMDDVTDDAAMMERLGVPVRIFPGSYANIKITTPEDLTVATALLAAREATALAEDAPPLT